MCGICGFVGKGDENLLREMARSIAHRGPDEDGFYFEEQLGLGMRRLKVIDLNTGSQPIYNEDKSCWIVFNGEIYNFQDLREDLVKKGHLFYTRTDTEVILHLYEEEGEECPKKLRGMFAFAIWDKKRKKLFLARDRIGKKPLHYYKDNTIFIFASEIKAILKYKNFSKELDLKALDFFLSYLYVPDSLSIFKGIKKLEPGSYITLEKGELKTRRYWNLSFGNKIKADEKELEDMVEKKLEEAVKIRLISDVPLGVFLSGGIDSSSVVAMMSRWSNNRVNSFSIGYGDEAESYNELEFSRLVAHHFGTNHQEFILKPDVVNLVYDIVSHFDEPFADSSSIPTYLISKVAREKVTVALSGIGGDELFAGYPRYLGARISNHYEYIPLILRKGMDRIFYKLIPESTESRNLGGWVRRFLNGGSLPEYFRYMSWVTFFNDDEKKELYSDRVKEGVKGNDIFRFHREFFEGAGSEEYLDRIFYLDQRTYLPDDLLVMGDRMSMANSLELRVPFCDHQLIELAASIPSSIKMKGFKLKYILKKMLKGILPAQILSRKKQGFMVPLGIWFKKDLKEMIRESLSEDNIRKRNYFNPAFIKWMLEEHFSGRRNYTDKIWVLLVFEVWNRVYMD